MEQKKLWKRLLSVILSVSMVVGLITVSGPNTVEASDGTSILTNGDFASANSAWMDQNGSSVPAQALVDDVEVTSEVKFTNDFAGTSPTWGWNIGNTTSSVVEKDGNKVLSFTPGTNTYIRNYGFVGWNNQLVVGENYRISCRVYSDTAVSFRLYDDVTGRYDWHTTTAGDWSTYTIDLTATANNVNLYFGFMDGASGTVYIDDVKAEQITTKINKETVYTAEFTNDFAGTSPTWGWNIGNTTSSVVEKDGNKVLSFSPGVNKYIYNYNFLGYGGLTVGENYRISCRVYSDTEISFRLYDDTTGKYDLHTTTAGDWSTYTIDLTATAAKPALYFHFMDGSTGTVYIDDLVIAKPTEAIAKIYTEGIGTCKNAEADNVLVMKDYTKVTQPVTITSGATYSYSFSVKEVKAGGDFAASVIAGNETVQTITATSEWTTVEGEFTATADAANFGFARTGEGELWIDDVVLIPSSTEPMPADHTSLEGPYIPDGHINLLSGAATDFSSSGHGHTVPAGATVQNGYLKTPIKSGYIQFGGMSTVAGQEYTFSCYIWTEGTGYKLQMYEAGVGSASGSNWEWLTYSCGKDTNGWVKVEYSFTAKGTGSVNIGFQETWGGEVTLYVDDVALTTAKPGPSDHTVQGGAYIPDGHINLLSGAATDFSSSGHGHAVPTGATVQNGYLKATMTAGTEIQFGGMSTVAGQEYTFSCYIWTENGTAYGLGMYEAGAGSASGSSWKKLQGYSYTKDTNGWVKVEYSFTANGTGPVYIGLYESWGGDATVTVYVDDVALTNEAAGEATNIKLTYGENSDFHYGQEYVLYIESSGTERKDLSGTLEINGREVPMTYQHHNGGLILLFTDKLSETEVNTVVIPAETTLYDGNVAFYKIAETVTIYTQKVADGQWMTWLSEYDYQGSDVLYYDMGTVGTKYTFNNNATAAYQGVMKVTGKAEFTLGGRENSSRDVTDLGDYKVTRTIKGEKYEYTVALYKRGDADKTQDGKLTAKDLVASKKAVDADEAEFGYARYKAADSNTDGVVNEEDAAFMRYILVNDKYDITTTTSKGYSTLGQGVMPIVGYGGPDDHDASNNTELVKRSDLGYEDDFLKEEIFGLVKDLGINVFTNEVNEVGESYEISTKMLKLAQKYNLGVFINNAYISNQSSVQEKLSSQTAKYESFSSFHGYYVADEPRSESAIRDYTTPLTALKNQVNIATYFNLLPRGSSAFSSDNEYKEYLNEALATGAESLSYDMYLRGKYQLLVGAEIKTSEFYKNLDVARTLSMNASKPFQAFVQTGANWIDDSSIDRVNSTNKLTVQEMYLEANAALAMGAKGITYFTLLESTKQVDNGDNYSGLITVSGEANHNDGGDHDYYNAAKKINTFIASVDEVLMNAENKGVITTDSTVKGYIDGAKTTSYGAVQSVSGNDAFVGCFDYYGKDAYLIVNITPDQGGTGDYREITLTFNGTYSYAVTDMECNKKTGSGQSASFTVGAGEAVLVVVE